MTQPEHIHEDLRYSGKDGSPVSDEDIAESQRRIALAEANEA
jgi:hypothetical protein